jgi:hypothetical protein
MVSYARATRGLRRPSLDTCSGRPSKPTLRREGGRARSLDARSEGRSACSHVEDEGIGRAALDGRSQKLFTPLLGGRKLEKSRRMVARCERHQVEQDILPLDLVRTAVRSLFRRHDLEEFDLED